MTGDEFRGQALRAGALVTGGPVPADFERGWGHQPFMRGMKAHHWVANREAEENGTYGLTGACGVYTVATRSLPLLEPGNLPFCVRCENLLMKKGSGK